MSASSKIRPRRNIGEGAIGYLMRLGTANGIRRLPDMAREVGIPWYSLLRGEYVENIAHLARMDLDPLTYDTAARSKSAVTLRGQVVRPKQWSVHGGRRACALCLADDVAKNPRDRLPRAWHRAWWDVRPVTTCGIHGVELASACATCGEKLSFRWADIRYCPNGHDLTLQKGIPASHLKGDRYVVGRLGGRQRESHPFLDGGSLGEAIDAMHLVGNAACDAGASPAQILEAGHSALKRWPTTFEGILDRLSSDADVGPGRWGAAATYGPLHTRLQEMAPGPLREKFRSCMRSHAARKGVSVSKPLFGATAPTGDFAFLTLVAEELGVGFDRARKELKSLGAIPANTRRGTPILIRSDDVDRLREMHSIDKTLSEREIAQRLTIGRAQASVLISAGFLGDRSSVGQTDIQKFMDGLRIKATSRRRKDATPLPDACRTGRCSIDVATRAILAGDLEIVGVSSESGLRGMMVGIADVRAVGKLSRGTMTVNDAAAALGAKWSTVRDLTRLKLIDADDRGVHRTSVEAFGRRFVAGARLAEMSGVRPRALVNLLSDAGVHPTASPPECRQVFYRRAELAGLSRRRSLPDPVRSMVGKLADA